jgi:preprotein translocase subunit YajC
MSWGGSVTAPRPRRARAIRQKLRAAERKTIVAPGRPPGDAVLDPRSGLCYAFPPVTHFLLAIAQQGQAPGPGSMLNGLLVPMVLVMGVMYLLVMRPQMKKQKETQKMLSELKKGDEVVTQGGIIGRISGFKDDEVTLQIQEGVRMRVLRNAIVGRHTQKTGEPPKTDAKAS